MFSQAPNTGCTFLLNVDNALKDVAKGSVILPLNRVFHNIDMPYSVHRVRVDRVLPGCEELDPPNQPMGEDEELKLGQLKNHYVLWPKALIRLNPTTPGSAPSQGRVTPPVDDHPEPATHHHDGGFSPIDDFIQELAAQQAPPRDSPEPEQHDLPADKAQCLKKKLFGSQETPEEAGPASVASQPVMFSPCTIHGATIAAMVDGGTPACRKRKYRKRPEKKPSAGASASQPPPNKKFMDKLPTKWRDIHCIGQPILPAEVVSKLTGEMQSVHNTVLHLEEDLLKERHPSYPLFVAKVPSGVGFVDQHPAELFFIRFDDVFNVFHLRRLDRTLVRLVTLSVAHDCTSEKTPNIAIMDPFFMLESIMASPRDRLIVSKQIEDFLVANKDKTTILIPYHPK